MLCTSIFARFGHFFQSYCTLFTRKTYMYQHIAHHFWLQWQYITWQSCDENGETVPFFETVRHRISTVLGVKSLAALPYVRVVCLDLIKVSCASIISARQGKILFFEIPLGLGTEMETGCELHFFVNFRLCGGHPKTLYFRHTFTSIAHGCVFQDRVNTMPGLLTDPGFYEGGFGLRFAASSNN